MTDCPQGKDSRLVIPGASAGSASLIGYRRTEPPRERRGNRYLVRQYAIKAA
jgi:hypothetical protein